MTDYGAADKYDDVAAAIERDIAKDISIGIEADQSRAKKAAEYREMARRERERARHGISPGGQP